RRPPWGRNPFSPTPLFLPEIRYLQPRDRTAYEIIQSVRTLTRAGQEDPRKRRGDFSFPSPAEALRRCGGDPGPLRETLRLAEQCSFSFELGGLRFPRFSPPDGSSPAVFLRRLVLDGARSRYGAHPSLHRRVLRQLAEELRIIREVGYADYFLLVWDLLQECRRLGIDWITRGSAADSLVCYCLGISGVCPVRFDLYFRRFLNRDRMAMHKLPDIDIDFPHDRREEVIRILFRRHGPDHCAVVGGFSTYQARSALAEIAKTLGVSEFQIRRFTECIPRVRARDLPAAVAESRECAGLPISENPYAFAMELAGRLDGFPRHPKTHPCGVVLSGPPVTDLSPLFSSASGWPATHLDMHSVEALGLVKMDILGQAGLSVLRDACASLRTRGIDARFGTSAKPLAPSPLAVPPQPASILDLDQLAPWEDPEVWKMIGSGGARGVHHVESPAMTTLNRMCRTRDIDCLIAIVSVIRPGAANELKKEEFARRYQGLSPLPCLHPSLEPVLRSTFGLIAYEEHVLQICEAFAGLDAGRADVLRRSLIKQDRITVERLGHEFARAAREKGRTPEEIEKVWSLLLGFQGYAFCRAHSTAYGVEAYQAAALKRYHPREFLAAVLTHGKGFYSRLAYTLECRRLGISILPPDVSRSDSHVFLPEAESIRVPLAVIRDVGDALPRRIVRERNLRPFDSLIDFLERVGPDAGAMGSLLRTGALDGFQPSRTRLFWDWRRHGTFQGKRKGELPMFAPPPKALPGQLEEPGRIQKLRDEMELLGFTASGHPLDLYPEIDWNRYIPLAELGQHPGRWVRICGLIVAERSHRQSDGRLMKFLTLADRTEMVETELFADACRRWGAVTARQPVVEISGWVESFANGNGFTLEAKKVEMPPPFSGKDGGRNRNPYGTPPNLARPFFHRDQEKKIPENHARVATPSPRERPPA
ncbi:MAG: DNA polymerase III subunit alpha, partial [Verrucomicrobia bacterium]|nr:DNA polymerase III subunit alpha [Verrucomicrobiota bacterium]